MFQPTTNHPAQGLDFIIDDVAGGDSWSGDDAVGMTWKLGQKMVTFFGLWKRDPWNA